MSYQPTLFRAPKLSAFTGFNTPTAAIQTAYGFNFKEPSNSSNNNVRGVTQAFTAPLSVSCKLVWNDPCITPANGYAGPGWTDTTGIIMVALFVDGATPDVTLDIRKYDNTTAFNSSYLTQTFNYYGGSQIWIKLEDDATDRKTYVSQDGVNFTLIHTVGNTDFITATEWGQFIDPYATDINVTFQGWNKL